MVKKKIKLLLVTVFLGIFLIGLFTTVTSGNTKMSGKIWIAGDSIAADHSYENEADYAEFVHGWGEVIGNYFNDDVVVYNKAISGQSAKYFVEENNYKDIIAGIGEGDLLLIQFGHNDYKSDGPNHYLLPTSTEGSYKWYLKNYYIDPALKVGAIPVLCTSVVCCEFVDGIVKEDQAQNLFAGAMRELYNEYKEAGIEIGLIDTYELTQNMLNAYSSLATSFYALKYDKGSGNTTTSLDHVHFSLKGATMTADMIAENLFVMCPDLNRFNRQEIVDGGKGTKENPYLISSFSQFYRILQDDDKNSPDKYYKLTSDLDPVIQNKENTTVFKANLDGDGHTLKNITGSATKSFIDINYGTISNLKLSYAVSHTCENIQYPFVGENYGVISNCSASGEIWYNCFLKESEEWYCGTFAGVNHDGGIIENCDNNAGIAINTDTTRTYLGGICGKNEGKIYRCSNSARLKIDATEYSIKDDTVHNVVHCISGGIAAIADDEAEFAECEASVMPVVMSTLLGESSIILKDYFYIYESSLNKSEIVSGDVDFDGKVTLSDASVVLRFALAIKSPDDSQFTAADADSDGEISLKDVNIVLRKALGIII